MNIFSSNSDSFNTEIILFLLWIYILFELAAEAFSNLKKREIERNKKK